MANRSEQIDQLATSLAKAQGVIKAAVKDTLNPFLKSRYADLASVWDACREQLAANGLAILQDPSFDGETVQVVTTLMHSSGQWWESTLRATPTQTTLQQIGAAITYLRRYAISSMVGIAAEEDDDGNAASHTAQAMSSSERHEARNEFAATALDECKAIIAKLTTVEEADAAAPAFQKLRWRNAGERKEGVALFQKRRAEIAAAPAKPEPALCRGCDAPHDKPHAPGCPETTPAPAARA